MGLALRQARGHAAPSDRVCCPRWGSWPREGVRALQGPCLTGVWELSRHLTDSCEPWFV